MEVHKDINSGLHFSICFLRLLLYYEDINITSYADESTPYFKAKNLDDIIEPLE